MDKPGIYWDAIMEKTFFVSYSKAEFFKNIKLTRYHRQWTALRSAKLINVLNNVFIYNLGKFWVKHQRKSLGPTDFLRKYKQLIYLKYKQILVSLSDILAAISLSMHKNKAKKFLTFLAMNA